MKNIETYDHIIDEVATLIKQSKITHIATTDNNHQPDVGYTQFVGNQNKIFVMMSEMTAHCTHILDGNTKISVMFTENDRDSKQLAALERFTANATATEIEYGTDLWKSTMEKLVVRCGKIYLEMEKMADFHMFELELNDARYVKGFGEIYDRTNNVWGRAKGKGHRNRV